MHTRSRKRILAFKQYRGYAGVTHVTGFIHKVWPLPEAHAPKDVVEEVCHMYRQTEPNITGHLKIQPSNPLNMRKLYTNKNQLPHSWLLSTGELQYYLTNLGIWLAKMEFSSCYINFFTTNHCMTHGTALKKVILVLLKLRTPRIKAPQQCTSANGIWQWSGVDLMSLNDVEKYIFRLVFAVSVTL